MYLSIHFFLLLLVGTFVYICFVISSEHCKNRNIYMMHKYDNLGMIVTLLYILFIMPLEYPLFVLFTGYLLYETCEVIKIDNKQ